MTSKNIGDDLPVGTEGKHLLLELWECDSQVLDSEKKIQEILVGVCDRINVHVLGTHFHRFCPQGVSGVVIISESHLSCHSWPEKKYIALDCYTCGDKNPLDAVSLLVKAFRANKYNYKFFARGIENGIKEIQGENK